MAIEPLDSITRICLAKELSAATWLRLLKEARAKKATGKDASDTAEDDLLHEATSLILTITRKSGTPLSQSYLQACLVEDEPKAYLLKRILEDATALDNRTNVDVQLNAYLECLAATLLASDPATITKIQTSISVGRNLDYLTASIKLLSTAAQNQLSSLFLLMLQFLQVYQARTTLSSGGQQDQAIGKEISMCRNLLANMTSTAAAVPYPFELAHKLLNSLERTYDPISYRRNSFLRPATFPSLPVEIELLLHSILYHQCQDAPSIFAGSIAARLAVQQAISANKDLDSAQEVLNFWCADLFSCCFRHAPMPDQPRSRTEARWRALVFGYLPTMLLDLKNHPSLRDAALDWSAAFEAGMSKGNGDSHQSGEALPGDWTSEMMDYISSAKRAGAPSSDFSADDLLTVLGEGLNDYRAQKAASAAVELHLSKWTAASDLPVIHHFLTSLVKETPRIMDYVLLHLNNSTLLKPICQILDAWNSSDEYGAGQAMELYGGILLATKTFIHRHALQKTVSNFNFGTASALVASSSVSGSAYPLQALSPEDRKLVSSWITALFGSEGIEDDLIRATAPRTMLLLAPTIVHQSVTAMENGIIDQETLLNGLSYFCQDFLTFTLPGIISYLANRDKPNLILIKSLLLSDSTPPCVFELVQDDLRDMLKKVDQNDEDAKLLQKNIKQAQLAVPLDRAPGSTTLAGSLELAIAASSKSLSQEDLLSMIRMHDPLTASVVVSQALRPVSQASLRTFTERAVSQLSLGLNEEANAKQVDDLADISALVAIRGGVHISEGNFPSLHAAFRKRISTWTLSRMV